MEKICRKCCESKDSSEYYNRTCSSFNQRKVKRPDIEVLIEEIKNIGYVKTGKKYGVSDNAIRKWVIVTPL